MKSKIKLVLSFTLILSMMFAVSNIQAQHKHPHARPVAKKQAVQHRVKAAHKTNMVSAIKVIKRTNHVILNAHKAVKKYKNYTGDLAKAVRHQQYAKILLKKHKAHKAMQHSRLARNYAFKAIKHNKGVLNRQYLLNNEESKTVGETISDTELEKELKTSNSNISFDDASISDKEMTELEVLDTQPSDYKNE